MNYDESRGYNPPGYNPPGCTREEIDARQQAIFQINDTIAKKQQQVRDLQDEITTLNKARELVARK